MNIKQSTLAAAVTAALAMGMSGQAAASVYAGSYLAIQDLEVVLTGVGPGTSIESFIYTSVNSASLNNVAASGASLDISCGGVPSPGSNTCGTGTDPALDALAANAPGGTIVRSNNDYSLFGPGTNTYSNADSVIYTSQLTGDATAATEQIAESELQSSGIARSSAEITSTTGFILNFVVDGTGELSVAFDADPFMAVAISDPLFLNGNAQANMEFSITLSNDDDGNTVSWSPQGTSVCNDLDATGTLACAVTDAGEDLNGNVSVSSNNSSDDFGTFDGLFSLFGIEFTGLYDGNWTLAFNALTSTSTRLEQQVPEPGILALLGIGLAGLGFAARRRKI